jgi:periplasmic protein TonB
MLTTALSALLGGCASSPEQPVHPPEYVTRDVRYPPLAVNNSIEGATLLSVRIDQFGKVRQIGIVKSSGSVLLDSAALESVSKWTFKPARRKDGTPISSVVTVPLRFTMPPRKVRQL